MSLYPLNVGNSPMPSDITQLINAFNGTHDIGAINLAPALSPPSINSFSLTAQGGNILGVGVYYYQFSYVTGQYKSDGSTLVQTGETVSTTTISITTTNGNTAVKINLPLSLPASVVAINIYRTSVNGLVTNLIATVKAGNASFTDNIADVNRGAQTVPTANTTGTTLSIPGQLYLEASCGANGYTSVPPGTDWIIPYGEASGIVSGGTFTAPSSGRYLFLASAYMGNQCPAGVNAALTLYTNGRASIVYAHMQNGQNVGDFAIPGPIMCNCNAGDQIKFALNTSAPVNLDKFHSILRVHKLS